MFYMALIISTLPFCESKSRGFFRMIAQSNNAGFFMFALLYTMGVRPQNGELIMQKKEKRCFIS
jgi:hypothetical protein